MEWINKNKEKKYIQVWEARKKKLFKKEGDGGGRCAWEPYL